MKWKYEKRLHRLKGLARILISGSKAGKAKRLFENSAWVASWTEMKFMAFAGTFLKLFVGFLVYKLFYVQ